mmetsp:Transcript_1697/g.5487  ORF Transcript_1697/g.5487 Transcript_1697/m.5487 type:complete len:173 (+) Transcript_1697:72-590(+)
MYFLTTMDRTIKLHPRHFGPRIDEQIRAQLSAEVEGRYLEGFGHVVAVFGADHVGMGIVDEETSFAHFSVRFRAIVCRPFKGEIVDGIVTSVSQQGIIVEVGPFQVFVSQSHMPRGVEFKTDGPPAFVGQGESFRIQRATTVRLKIMGTLEKGSKITSLGTVAPDWLGPLPA